MIHGRQPARKAAIGDDNCNEYRVDGKCACMFSDSEDNQCNWKSTTMIIKTSSLHDICQPSAIISTNPVLHKTEDDL